MCWSGFRHGRRPPLPGCWPATRPLLGLLTEVTLKKSRWNLAILMGRLPLTVAEARRVAAFLEPWLEDSSSIIKTAALQGLADMARMDPSLLPGVLDVLRIRGRSGTPAMRARTRHLLAALEPEQDGRRKRRPASPATDRIAD